MKILAPLLLRAGIILILGVVFWLCYGGKARTEKQGTIYVLELKHQGTDTSKWIMLAGTTTVFGGDSEPVKIYQGQWVEDIKPIGCWWSSSYLEVTK